MDAHEERRSKWKFVRKTPTNQAALLFDDFGELCLRTMRSRKDFETRTSIWKVREPGCYGLRDQSRAKMAKSSRAVKRERKKKFHRLIRLFRHSCIRAMLCDHFYVCYCGKIDSMNSWCAPHKTNDLSIDVLHSKRYRLLYTWICSCAILIEKLNTTNDLDR